MKLDSPGADPCVISACIPRSCGAVASVRLRRTAQTVLAAFLSALAIPAAAENPLRAQPTASERQGETLEMDATFRDREIAELRARVAELERMVEGLTIGTRKLEQRTACISRSGSDTYFTGCNVHVRDGSGDTDGETNGLGNLVIGYNEAYVPGSGRGGSHNLVVGSEHSYSSFGGFVAGFYNTVSAPYASVSGGAFNIASMNRASVAGGERNRASALASFAAGGADNTAAGEHALVVGGLNNAARGNAATVTGGAMNSAPGEAAIVAGGSGNRAEGIYASVIGGELNHALAPGASINGGNSNRALGRHSSVTGGRGLSAAEDESVLVGVAVTTAAGEPGLATGPAAGQRRSGAPAAAEHHRGETEQTERGSNPLTWAEGEAAQRSRWAHQAQQAQQAQQAHAGPRQQDQAARAAGDRGQREVASPTVDGEYSAGSQNPFKLEGRDFNAHIGSPLKD